MAKTYNDNLRSPEFRKLLEESKLLVQRGKHGDKKAAAYNMLSYMKVDKDENNRDLFYHTPDRKLAEWLGMDPEGAKGIVVEARKIVRQERFGIITGGCVYILTNPSMPGLIKVGKTKYSAYRRAQELYRTGVPEPFVVEHWVEVSDPKDRDRLERSLKKGLKKYRINKNREFFRYPVDKAIEWLKKLKFSFSVELFDVETL